MGGEQAATVLSTVSKMQKLREGKEVSSRLQSLGIADVVSSIS
jgi:hypothetical protein